MTKTYEDGIKESIQVMSSVLLILEYMPIEKENIGSKTFYKGATETLKLIIGNLEKKLIPTCEQCKPKCNHQWDTNLLISNPPQMICLKCHKKEIIK